MIEETREEMFLRITGKVSPEVMLKTTGQLLYKIWELEEQGRVLQGYISSMQAAAAEVYNRDTDTY